MAVELLDGYTVYRSADDLDAARYTLTGTSSMVSIQATGGPSSRGALRLGGNRAASFQLDIALPTAAGTRVVGFDFMHEGLDIQGSSYDNFFVLKNGTTGMLHIRLDDDGAMRFFRYINSTEYWDTADDNIFFVQGQHYTIELVMTHGLSNTFDIDVYIDGELTKQLTGLASSYSTSDGLEFQSGVQGDGSTYEISNLYVTDDTDPLLIWKVQQLTMNADTAQADFTPSNGGTNVAEIDDTSLDQDGGYNSSNTTNHEDRFTSGTTLEGTNSKVKAVQVVFMAREDSTNGNMRATCYHGTTKGSGTSRSVLAGGDYIAYTGLFAENPDTTAEWTKAEAEAAEYGYEVL